MAKVTILGAGISGMAIASLLPRIYDVTIVARDLPGEDHASQDWASPWAGAVWMPVHGSTPGEQKMQLDALSFVSKLAVTHPECSARTIEMREIMDYIPSEEVWYHKRLPEYRVMSKDELPQGASHGISFRSFVLTPTIFLPWLRQRLESRGVVFKKINVRSLEDLKGLGHDVLINATAVGSRYLLDVADQEIHPVRSQTVLVKSDLDYIFLRHGKDYTKDYTYALPRLDGTVILGGIRDYGNLAKNVESETRTDILTRIHQCMPDRFPSNPANFHVIKDLVGIQPMRDIGSRIDKEVLNGQKVVHAYGIIGGGYILSFGLARRAVQLVYDFELEQPRSKL